MDHLQWMGAVRMRVQTDDKKHHNNPQVIHTTPVHQLMFFRSDKLCVCKKQTIIKMF